MKQLLYCYTCGEFLGEQFYLIAFKKQTTDRVFLVCKKDSCIQQVDTTMQEVIPVLKEKIK